MHFLIPVFTNTETLDYVRRAGKSHISGWPLPPSQHQFCARCQYLIRSTDGQDAVSLMAGLGVSRVTVYAWFNRWKSVAAAPSWPERCPGPGELHRPDRMPERWAAATEKRPRGRVLRRRIGLLPDLGHPLQLAIPGRTGGHPAPSQPAPSRVEPLNAATNDLPAAREAPLNAAFVIDTLTA